MFPSVACALCALLPLASSFFLPLGMPGNIVGGKTGDFSLTNVAPKDLLSGLFSLNSSSFEPLALRPFDFHSRSRHEHAALALSSSQFSLFALQNETTPRLGSPAARKLQAVAFTCQSLSSVYDPTTMCSGVVDYPFVVMDGQSLADLEATARSMAVMGNAFLKTSCLIDIKRFICANVYQQCVPGGESLLPLPPL